MAAIYINDSENRTLEIDAVISDSRNYSAKITSKPIEDGSNINDSKILENIQFTIEGYVSNTPIVKSEKKDITVTPDYTTMGKIANFLDLNTFEYEKLSLSQVHVDGPSPLINAYKFLTDLYASTKPFSIEIDGLDNGEFDNLMMKSLKVDFTPENGESLHFTIEFEQIKIVASQTTKVPKPKVAEKKNLGTQQKKDTKKEEIKKPVQSILKKIFS